VRGPRSGTVIGGPTNVVGRTFSAPVAPGPGTAEMGTVVPGAVSVMPTPTLRASCSITGVRIDVAATAAAANPAARISQDETCPESLTSRPCVRFIALPKRERARSTRGHLPCSRQRSTCAAGVQVERCGHRASRFRYGRSRTLPVVSRPSSFLCAWTASERGSSSPMRTSSKPSAIQVNISFDRACSSAGDAM